MRISTNQMFTSGVSAMQRAQAEVTRTSLQMATGRRILTPADDPSGATQSVMLQAAISKTEQYQRNADLALPKLEQEESQIDAVQDYLQRARELVVTANNDTNNAADRKIMATEIRQIRDAILEIANSQDSNGEYLFSGIDSFEQPFETNGAGAVDYVGAEGTGAVREVAISSTRNILIGDTGKSVFMSVPEESGWAVEGVPDLYNVGDVAVVRSDVVDKDAFDLDPDEVYSIQFTGPPMQYEVRDSANAVVTDDTGTPISGAYSEGLTIEFAGRSAQLSGTPQAGDRLYVRPASEVSVFDTLDAIATALENPAADDDRGVTLDEATAKALQNLDSSLEHSSNIRTTVGLRISAIETQTDLNDQRVIDLETTLSEVRDLDYAEAISRFKLQETVLQAAQQSYVQVSRLSLFDFL